MADAIYLALTAGFFWLTWSLVRLCEHLCHRRCASERALLDDHRPAVPGGGAGARADANPAAPGRGVPVAALTRRR